MEQRTEVKTYRVTRICDVCREGEMKPTGVSHPVWPVRYQHQCEKCGDIVTFTFIYPRTEYEDVIKNPQAES